MVASRGTVERVAEIIARYVDSGEIEDLCREMEEVPGNVSFRDTIRGIVACLRDPEGWRKHG